MADKRVTELTAIDAVVGSDLVLVVDDPAGTAVTKKATVTQVLVNVARTDVSNTFAGDQTVDGDLFVTGEINPVRLAEQKLKIDAFSAMSPGDPVGSRTVMSRSLVSGLSLRHDEEAALARVTVGNYDTQLYQPLNLEAQSLRVLTGAAAVADEHLRVHPSGGVTVGMDHTTDPGVGVVQAGGLGTTSLNADSLSSGTVPAARLTAANLPTHASRHNAGGADALAIDAAAATGSLRTLGTTSTTACAGNDSRLTNSRTPTAHASTHKTGQADVIKLDELGAPTDVTTLNASTSAHGLLPKLSNVATQYLSGQGTWTAPAGGGSGDVTGPGSSVSGDVPMFGGTTGKTLTDSGILASNIVLGPASATSANVATFSGTSGKVISDSGLGAAALVSGPGGAVTAGTLATWTGTSGTIIGASQSLPVLQVARRDTANTFVSNQTFSSGVTTNGSVSVNASLTITSATGAPGFNLSESQAASGSRNWQMYTWNGTMFWIPVNDAWTPLNSGFRFMRNGDLYLVGQLFQNQTL